MRQKSLPISVRSGSPPARRVTLRPPRQAEGARTARDWLLTLPMVLLLPGLLLPLVLAAASEPPLSVRGDVRPGGLIEVVGTASGSIQTIDFIWDGAAVSWLPATPTDDKGSFALTTTVAASVAPGIHQLSAIQEDRAGGERLTPSIAVEVHSAPLAIPSLTPTPSATGAQVAAPTSFPTPSPEAAAVVGPTVATVGSLGPTSVGLPGVAGYGAGTTGGSGGKVYSVSTWSQLKAALLASGPRIVRLTGSADLDGGGDTVKIKNGNLTIDGSGWSGSLRRYSIVIATSNVIVTQLRLRPGDQVANPADGDALTINPDIGGWLTNVVIDRSSLLWAPDVTLAILNNVSNVTVQYSILGGGLYRSAHPEASAGTGHSYGPNVTTAGSNSNPATEYGRGITFYRNYIVHNNGRNIRAQGTDGIEYINNVVYNWGDQLSRLNPRGANVVGNMFKPGPNTTVSNVKSDGNESYPTPFTNSVYWAGNLGLGVTPKIELAAGVLRSSPYGALNVAAAPASSALAASVVAGAGPSLVDSIDQRLKNDFSSGGGSFYNGAGYPGPNPTWQGGGDSGPVFFTDIGRSPFAGDIRWLLEAGITSGCDWNRFCPRDSVTREQMATFLTRALQLPSTTRDFFVDDEGSVHEGSINRLAASGITSGCGPRRFCPRSSVTREQMASFIARAWRLPSSTRDFFTDDARSVHESDIDRLAAAGITGGCASTRFCPSDNVTREQMAAFLRRSLTD